jgi:hypothetical protein
MCDIYASVAHIAGKYSFTICIDVLGELEEKEESAM